MELFSPQAEHSQLMGPEERSHIHKLLLAPPTMLRPTATAESHSNSSRPCSQEVTIDSLLDDHPIPSPPLSPKFGPLLHDASYLRQIPELTSRKGILVRPSWNSGLTAKHYKYATFGFLSQYSILGDSMKKSTNHRTYRRYTRHSRNGPSDIEKVYRTRHYRYRTTASTDSEEDDRRLATPVRRAKKPTYVSSPLASATAINKAPQYVPNMSWEKLPDYSPSVSTLPENNVKSLKVEWKGSPMDLSHDPLKKLLHPAELVLAQILRLPCDLYLDSKRRLFLEKVFRLKKNLPFRRTDAQKACRIDVNKASRLYAAYEKVGWLDDSNFTKFI